MNWYDLPIDIRVEIVSYFESVWVFLAIRDQELYDYTCNNLIKFVKLFTTTHVRYVNYAYAKYVKIIEHKLFNRLHMCINDIPAVIVIYPASVDYYYFQNNELYRVGDRPAIDCGDGEPAVRYKYTNKYYPCNTLTSGCMIWISNGKVHRSNDNPAVITNSYQAWYHYGKQHRENNLPAHISKITLAWYYNGKIHRDNIYCGEIQPAIIRKNKKQLTKTLKYISGCCIDNTLMEKISIDDMKLFI